MSLKEQRKDPSDLTDDELLERIASKDGDKFPLVEVAQEALENGQGDSS